MTAIREARDAIAAIEIPGDRSKPSELKYDPTLTIQGMLEERVQSFEYKGTRYVRTGQ